MATDSVETSEGERMEADPGNSPDPVTTEKVSAQAPEAERLEADAGKDTAPAETSKASAQAPEVETLEADAGNTTAPAETQNASAQSSEVERLEADSGNTTVPAVTPKATALAPEVERVEAEPANTAAPATAQKASVQTPEVERNEADPGNTTTLAATRKASSQTPELGRSRKIDAEAKNAAALAVTQKAPEVERMEADAATGRAPVVTQKEWMSLTVATLSHTQDRAKQVQEAVRALEQQQADRLAAQRAKRRIQVLEAMAVEKKQRDALVAERDKRYRELQADELKQQQELLAISKKKESQALRNATDAFNKEKQASSDAKEKDRVMTALNNMSQLVLSGTLECQHTISKLWGIMMLCDKRQRLRENRPQTETFRDSADQALKREWQMLTTSRTDLNDLATRGEACRADLEKLHVQLRTEESRNKSSHRFVKSPSLPALVPGQQQHQANMQMSQKDIIKMALAMMDDAAELPRQTKMVISKVNSWCDLAVTDVNTSLDRRKTELGELINGLHQQKADAESTIGDAEKRITRLRRRVQNTMETPRSSKSTEDQLASAESLLVDLRSLRRGLEADLRNKCHALKIDESCRQLTKVKSGGHVSKMGQTQSMRKTNNGPFMRKTAKDGVFSQIPAAEVLA